MNKSFYKIAAAVTFAVTPYLAYAATLRNVIETVGTLIKTATPVVVALALVYFFYNLATYLIVKDDDKKKSVNAMIYGVIILFVMVSVWGIVNVLAETFQVGNSPSITPPTVNQ